MDVFSAVIVFIAFLLVLRAEWRLEGMQTRLDRLAERLKRAEAVAPDPRLRVWTNPRFAKAGRPDHPAA
jgi:hypothetical protein